MNMDIAQLAYDPRDEKWKAKAKCANFNVDEFFPETGVNIHHLKEFCGTCPVAAECLDYALKYQMDFGVWGGTSVNERYEIRRGRKEHPYAAVRG